VATARAGGIGRFVGFFPTTQTRTPLWFDVVVSAITDASGAPEALLAVSRDVTEWKRTEELLRAITDGTASVTGEQFFHSLVEQLARGLKVRYAFVAECLPGGRARSLAFWQGDRHGGAFEYDLAGTPCEGVVAGRTCFHPSDLQARFPLDAGLVDLAADSYLGVPLVDSRRSIVGHLVVMDDRPMAPDALHVSVMETFAARAGAELERVRTHDALATAHAELERRSKELRVLLDVNRAVGRHLERDALFGALARCLRRVFETDRFGIELPIEGNRLQGHLLTPHALEERPTRVKVLPADGTACGWVLDQGTWLVAATRAELRDRFPRTFEVMTAEGMEALCAIPLTSAGRARSVLFFMAARPAAYDHLPRALLEQVAGAVAVALDDCLAHEEVQRLRDRLAAENTYLQEEIRSEHHFADIVGNSAPLVDLLRTIEQVAPTGATVLILGETGTGKELIARAIHDRSPRHDRPLVKVNCAAITAGLVESELFGHVRGAFTGAMDHRDGRFKVADGGTIFLDEVGELPLETQVKLLRVLQEQEFEPVGSSRTQKVDVRVIAATNRDLEAAVREGRFRSDLFYRLNVLPLRVPTLAERADDIPALVTYFVQQFAKSFGKPVVGVSDDTMRRLCAYPWPGNVRELHNVIERAVVLASGPVLTIDARTLPTTAAPAAGARPTAEIPERGAGTSLEEVERQHILAVLAQVGGRIEGSGGAARVLGLSPSTLRSRMQRLGIARSRAS
jgi:formate hydrogenlyase transcriptional activator